MSDIRLSVLDLVPVRANQTSHEAISSSISLAKLAEDHGYHRYWVAEHHNMPQIASTTPAVMLAMLGSATERIRLGSGGVMLPNHAPLAVAEQFAMLEAAFPGRVDLGIGRAPGTDPVTSWALRQGISDADVVSRFPDLVDQVRALTTPEGAGMLVNGRTFPVHATPHATSAPTVWLLGSSDYSARLAAERGYPYVFATHFFGKGTSEALSLYRNGFQPSPTCAEPTTFITANVCVAETDDEAWARALPHQHSMARLRTGAPLEFMATVEQAQAGPAPAGPDVLEAMAKPWLVGTPEAVAEQVRGLAAHYEVDEVMVQPISAARDADPLDRSPGREDTLRLLAEALG